MDQPQPTGRVSGFLEQHLSGPPCADEMYGFVGPPPPGLVTSSKKVSTVLVHRADGSKGSPCHCHEHIARALRQQQRRIREIVDGFASAEQAFVQRHVLVLERLASDHHDLLSTLEDLQAGCGDPDDLSPKAPMCSEEGAFRSVDQASPRAIGKSGSLLSDLPEDRILPKLDTRRTSELRRIGSDGTLGHRRERCSDRLFRPVIQRFRLHFQKFT